MGLSSSKNKTTTNQKTSETANVTPTNPPFVVDSIKGFTDKVNAFGNTDPYQYVAPASPLQNSAWDQAPKQLGGWRDGLAKATNAAEAAGNASVSLNGPSGYAARPADAAQIGDMERAESRRGKEFMEDYRNPYLKDVVDTTLSEYDLEAGRTRAAQAAHAARNGAFSGSRFALREAQTEGELGRGRAATEAGLRDRAFNTAAGLGMQDADRLTSTNMFNTGQTNAGRMAQAQLQQQTNLYNTGAENQSRQFGAGAFNQFALADAQLAEQAAQRQLASAGVMGDMATTSAGNSRADLGLLSDMGNQQRAVEQGYRVAPIAQLETQGNLLGSQPYNLLSGKNIQSDGTMSGTTTQKQGMNLFQTLLMGAERAAQAAAAGG